MEMNQVRYFLAICEEGTFSAAAKRCGVAQPSLTRAIKLLEKELGGTLLRRGQRRSRLTDLGRAVLPELENIERSVRQAKSKAALLAATAPAAAPAAMRRPFVTAPASRFVAAKGLDGIERCQSSLPMARSRE